MNAPTCYVIDAATWNAAWSDVGLAFVLCLVAVYAASVDWLWYVDRYRVHQRRRRINEIRWTRVVAKHGAGRP